MLRVVRMVEERFHRDVENRPIREGRTPPEYLRPGDLEYRTCPYAGSRHQHPNPMNVSALRQTSAHWDEIVDALAFLRSSYTEVRGASGPDVLDLWRTSQLASCLPWFYLFRGEPIPAYAAALAKATLGVGIWAQRELVDRFGADPQPAWTAAAIVERAEANGTLIGETEVCSAGDKMLLRFFEVLAAFEPPYAGAGPVAQLLDARDELLAFGDVYLGFKQALWTYWLARRFVYADLIEERGPLPPLRELLDAAPEPPDFFLLEPSDPARLGREARAAWFDGLAALHLPLTALGAGLGAPLRAFTEAMGEPRAPVARLAHLDELFGKLVVIVEAGLAGHAYDGDFAAIAPVEPGVRDLIVPSLPRALLDRA